jgi:hypothetical protein
MRAVHEAFGNDIVRLAASALFLASEARETLSSVTSLDPKTAAPTHNHLNIARRLILRTKVFPAHRPP